MSAAFQSKEENLEKLKDAENAIRTGKKIIMGGISVILTGASTVLTGLVANDHSLVVAGTTGLTGVVGIVEGMGRVRDGSVNVVKLEAVLNQQVKAEDAVKNESVISYINRKLFGGSLETTEEEIQLVPTNGEADMILEIM